MAAPEEEEEALLDYEEEDVAKTTTTLASRDVEKKGEKNKKKGGYVGMHSTGFRDFLLKPELLRAIVDCGFEHPSEGNYTHIYSQENIVSSVVNSSSLFCLSLFSLSLSRRCAPESVWSALFVS